MNFQGKAKRLESLDISRIAATIGCGEDHLHAVMEVETRGGGFDSAGRPKMLFEPHIFYRELKGAQRDEAVIAGLAYRKWGSKKYPRDSYPRLTEAMRINKNAALRSASWGLPQMMGFNCKLTGYPTAEAMVEAFKEDEDIQLEAMVKFIVATKLDDDLRREDWRGFARGYNGPGYASHGYHTKLARAYAKWKRIPDTPFDPKNIDRSFEDPNPPSLMVDRGILRRGSRGATVIELQKLLEIDPADGIFGRGTEAAVIAFQRDQGLGADGIVGPATWDAVV